tara:strand:- start:1671 stop:2231 length:561 start_codon:yes stop_codon:yes gene_type:complete
MGLLIQKIPDGSKTEIALNTDSFRSMIFTNTHATDAVTIDLWLTDLSGDNVVTTGVYVNNGSGYTSAPGTAMTMAVDNGAGGSSAATDDMFNSEKVYKSDGTHIGTCTEALSSTSLSFANGLVKLVADNTILYVGQKYYIYNNVVIPNGASLQLTDHEIDYNNNNYNLYIESSNASGYIDIITTTI